MATRRKLTGRPLLLATAGVAMAVGCGGRGSSGPVVTGNLVPPPPIDAKICVDTIPETATVRIDQIIREERCSTVETYGPNTQIHVSAPGYVDHTVTVDATSGSVEVHIALDEEGAMREPVGNLMPPPDMLGDDDPAGIPELQKVRTVTVCVDVTPTGSVVQAEGTTLTERCMPVAVSDGSVSIDVTGPNGGSGHGSAHREVPVPADGTPVEIAIDLPPKPIPPPERPVGNLMPPPRIEELEKK